MKRACVLGMGVSGQAAARYLEQSGYSVTCVDDDLKRGVAHSRVNIEEFSLFVPSPGIARTHPLYLAAKKAGIEIAGEMELGLRELEEHFCIAVTGTNGKTTVVKWVEQLLNDNGVAARAIGNVGQTILGYLEIKKPKEVLIVEVSSFQLETMKKPIFDLGFLLNITKDHLSRYVSFEEYAETKCHIENCMRGKFYVQGQVAQQFSHYLQHPFEIYEIDPIVKTGRWNASHDLENATVVWRIAHHFGISKTAFCLGLDALVKPAHRLECLGEINGVTFYNDSKATNVDATLKALSSLPTPIILLAGGVDKGGSFAPILEYKERIRSVLAFGESREKLTKELGVALPVEVYKEMRAAAQRAKELAKQGDTVLFSPGCASFDEFTSYAHRGEQFTKIIHQKEKT